MEANPSAITANAGNGYYNLTMMHPSEFYSCRQTSKFAATAESQAAECGLCWLWMMADGKKLLAAATDD